VSRLPTRSKFLACHPKALSNSRHEADLPAFHSNHRSVRRIRVELTCKSLPLRRFKFGRTLRGRVTSDRAVAHEVCGSSKSSYAGRSGTVWIVPLRLARPFRACLAVSRCLPSLDLFGSSSSFLELSIFFSVRVRSPALRAFRTSIFRSTPGRPSSASLGVSSLFATSIECSNDVGSHASRHGLSRVTPVGTCPFGLSARGVLHAFDGLLRSRSCGLVSSRCHVQVFGLQGILPCCGSVPDFSGPFPSCR